jgi:hypothetical protein
MANPSSSRHTLDQSPSSHTGVPRFTRIGAGEGPHEPLQESKKGKGKAKVKEGKTKVKERKVHKCTYEGCDKTFITLAHVRRHLRTRESTPLTCFSSLPFSPLFPSDLASSPRPLLNVYVATHQRHRNPALPLRFLRKTIRAE